MKRRDFVGKLGIGTAVLMTPAVGGAAKPRTPDKPATDAHDHGHEQAGFAGPLANATINFGQWKTSPPLNRYPNLALPPAANNHHLLPSTVWIREGGSVTFLISGLHQILVYGPDVQAGDVAPAPLVATTGNPAGVPLVDNPLNRIYRGPDPSVFGTLDRIESVHFPNRGKYLVICGVLPHFTEGMFGYVRVLP
jgi:hypothetical protein